MDLYSELGDNIALQYGGSEAHKKVSSSSGPGKQASVEVIVACCALAVEVSRSTYCTSPCLTTHIISHWTVLVAAPLL